MTDALGGAAAGVTTELLFYGLDSLKVMQQAGNTKKYSFRAMFRGAVPIALLGSGPSFGTFFALYEPSRRYALTEPFGVNHLVGCTLAAAGAGVAASLTAVPADVIKKRVVLGVDNSVRAAFKNVLRESGLPGLWSGWRANLAKDVPFAAIKMSLYEGLATAYLRFTREDVQRKLTVVERAGVGMASGVATAVLTCPLDCVNTRIKSGDLVEFQDQLVRAHYEIVRRDGARALFLGLPARCAILGFGSTVFWSIYGYFSDVLAQ